MVFTAQTEPRERCYTSQQALTAWSSHCLFILLCVYMCVFMCERVAVKCLFAVLLFCSCNSVSNIPLYLVAVYVIKKAVEPICHLLSMQIGIQQHLLFLLFALKALCF